MMITHVVLSNLSGFEFSRFFGRRLPSVQVVENETRKAIRDDELVRFCRTFLLLEWERSLPATWRGGAPCKASND